jgi:D-arabinose 1-dehydrogenase-like Zn-dependent alcohol dehydrogenase
LPRVLGHEAAGVVNPTVPKYAFEDVPAAYDDLRHGRVVGRAVVKPVAG